MNQPKFTEEDRDVFAMSFYVFAMTDPRAIALREAHSPIGSLLDLYKDRPFLSLDPSNQ